jgi:thiosulfate/3-mercaptopyruvate sulfurtransferase
MNRKLGFLVFLPPLVLALVPRTGENAYTHPELLIEASQLARRKALQQYVVLDVRERPKYERGHVPNARWVDGAAWAEVFVHGTDADGWSRRIGALGIGPETHVVVYDDNFSKDAAHVWWVLRYWGVVDVRLLNGGWTAWAAGAHPIDQSHADPVPVYFVAQAHAERLATTEQLLQLLGGGSLQLVDARSRAEYCGIEKLHNLRAGAIPGARHLEWIDLIDRQTHRFKTAADLRRLFAEADIALDRPTAAYCQAGVRAAVMVLALELMGVRNVSNYYPSWAEWSNTEDAPVAKEPRP